MRSFRSKSVGWQRDNYRHYLAAKGISLKYKAEKERLATDEELRKFNAYVEAEKKADRDLRREVINAAEQKMMESLNAEKTDLTKEQYDDQYMKIMKAVRDQRKYLE